MDGLLGGMKVCSMRGTLITALICSVLSTLGYLCTRLCLCIKACQPVYCKGVTGLARRSARALNSPGWVCADSGASVAHAVALAKCYALCRVQSIDLFCVQRRRWCLS